MTVHEFLDVTGQGAMLAVALRWLFHLNIDVHWAVCIGAVSLLLQPWLNLHFGPLAMSHTLPDLLIGGAVAAALLGVVQIINGH